MDKEGMKEFWDQKEQELGEPILSKSLVHFLRSRRDEIPGDSWCLAYLTDSRMFIQSGGSSNWFSKLMDQGGKDSTEWPVLTIHRAQIQSVKVLKGQGWFSRLLRQPVTCRVFWQDENGPDDCTMEMETMEFLQPLLEDNPGKDHPLG